MKTPNQQRPSDLDRVLAQEPRPEADRLRAVWEVAGREAPTDFPHPEAVDRIWQSLDAFAASRETAPPRPRAEGGGASKRRLVRLPPWMAVAATVLVGAVVGALALWMSPVVQTAAPGQRLAVALPDGSQIELNSGTTLRYARRFGDERVVHLDGEAFFDVAEEERPFIVHTYNAQVAVLGTRFNVRAWRRSMDPGTIVTLASGRVALAPAERPEEAVLLAPGQTGRIAQTVHEPSPADTVAVAWAWRTGDFMFKDQWLGVILEEAERRFAVDLPLAPPSLREKRLNIVLRTPATAEEVIRDVCMALGLNYRATSTGYEIYAPSSK